MRQPASTRPASGSAPGSPSTPRRSVGERVLLCPTEDPAPPAHTGQPRRHPSRHRGPHRRRWVWLLALALLVTTCAVAATGHRTTPVGRPAAVAAVAPDASVATAAAPSPPPTLPVPLPTVDSCTPGSPLPVCNLPTTTAPPPTSAAGCTGQDCIPQPVTTTPGTGGSSGSGGGSIGSECSFWDPGTWLSCLFAPIVTSALNGLLAILGTTLLTTPSPSSIPQLATLWTNSWQVLVASYGLLVLVAGLVVMAYGTLQSRYSIKEIAPRVAVGFLAGTLSLFAATKMIELANGLAFGLVAGPVDAGNVATDLNGVITHAVGTGIITNALGGGIWLLFVGLVLAVMLIVLLVTYLVRVAITVLLIAAAPVLLMFHALPQTDGLARWWWKAFAGVLAIQIAQSLVLAMAVNTLLSPATAALFGG